MFTLVSASAFSLFPTVGPVDGGTKVTVYGLELFSLRTVRCLFGKLEVVGRVLNFSQILCDTPKQNSGTVVLRLHSMNSYLTIKNLMFFQYVLNPHIVHIQPSIASVEGGTLIQVHLVDSIDKYEALCRFGQILQPTKVLSRWNLACTAPQSNISAVTFTLVWTMLELSSNSLPFRFESNVKLISVIPSQATTLGGTLVHITFVGSMSASQPKCRFRHTEIAAAWSSENTLTCVTPESIPGLVFLEISLNGYYYSHDRVHFEFLSARKLLAIYPSYGPVKGDTIVSLNASGNFSTMHGCRISIDPIQSHQCRFKAYFRNRTRNLVLLSRCACSIFNYTVCWTCRWLCHANNGATFSIFSEICVQIW